MTPQEKIAILDKASSAVAFGNFAGAIAEIKKIQKEVAL